MYLMSGLSSRNELPTLLNSMGLTGVGVEVGSHRGVYAEILLARWKGEKMYCVDPWERSEGYADQVQYLADSDGDRSKDYRAFVKRTSNHKDRLEVIHDTSLAAYQKLWKANIRPDFVYLDGNHKPPHVEQDIRQWWFILKDGGMLAGHDFLLPGVGADADDNWGKYIQPAVGHYFRNMTVYLIVEEGNLPWTYYVIKEGGKK